MGFAWLNPSYDWKSQAILSVMPRLVAGIHVLLFFGRRGWPGQARPWRI